MRKVVLILLCAALALTAVSCVFTHEQVSAQEQSSNTPVFAESSAPEESSALLEPFSEELSEEESVPAHVSAPEESSALLEPFSEELSEEESVPAHVSAEESADIDVSSAMESAVSDPAEESSAPAETVYYTLRINEIMASSSLYKGPDGKPCDWIELYNYGDTDVDLSGLYLSDSSKKYNKDEPLCGVVSAGGYAVVYACGETGREGGVNRMSFTLSKGETVALFSPEGVLLSSATLPDDIKKDNSFAYHAIWNAGTTNDITADGYSVTTLCTPGYENGEKGYEEYLAVKDEDLGELVIYELMTINFEYYAQNGKYYDWVELKNVSQKTIDLGNYYISDDPGEPFMWNFPSRRLEPGKTVTVFCSGGEVKSSSKYLHASFKLNSASERLVVSRADGTVSDSVYISNITYAGSFGRMDGENGFFYFASPTPGENNKNGKRYVAHIPCASVEPGLYPGNVPFEVALSGEGVIRYTLDGSEPTAKSPVYTAPIRIGESTVVRASSFAEGKVTSPVMTAEYILCSGHTLPVVCIAADPDDMFSEERGIWYGEYEDRNANFRQNWERKAHFSLFDTNGETVFADCGVKLTGEGSRKLPKKSLQLKFRSRYGMDVLEYDIFGNGSFTEFETLKLRVGEDYPSTIFRDELITSIAAETCVTVQSYRYCVLYLNGEYYGIYAFRNKIDEHFISDVEGCEKDKVIVVDYNGSAQIGPKKPFRDMYSFVTGSNMSKPENYAKACEMIDMQSLADWVAIQAFTGNTDLGNDRAYRAGDGKWKWLLYDVDWGFTTNKKAYYLFTYNKSTAKLTKALLKNKDFKDLFLTRLAYICNVVYSPEKVDSRIAELVEILSSEVPANAARWRFTVKSWKKSIEKLRSYVSARRAQVMEQTKAQFGLSDKEIKKYFG